MGAPAIREKIIAALERSKGQTVTVTVLMQETGATRSGVQSVMNELLKSGKARIDVMSSGSVWVYHGPRNGNGNGERALYEEIGRASDGRVVLQDMDGKLYIGKEL